MKAACRCVQFLGGKRVDNLVRESVCANAGIDVSRGDWAGSLYPCLLSLRLDTNKHRILIKNLSKNDFISPFFNMQSISLLLFNITLAVIILISK